MNTTEEDQFMTTEEQIAALRADVETLRERVEQRPMELLQEFADALAARFNAECVRVAPAAKEGSQ